jgi:excisionase family DNA binding protein
MALYMPTKALTTGQAAKYCFVTSDTIVNWIKSDQLQARRTAGGQFRILVEDLRAFMLDHGMETDLLDAVATPPRYCWEAHGSSRAGPIDGTDCKSCLVYRARARRCFELRCALATDSRELEACEGCRFLDSWNGAEEQDGKFCQALGH